MLAKLLQHWICAAVFAKDAHFRALLAVALDPFVRWYVSRPALAASRIYRYADDLANAMKAVYRMVPLVLHALHHWRRASGLALKPSKCIILPLWDGDYSDLRTFVCALPGFTAGAVRTNARYLGVDLGVTAATTQWDSITPRLTRRAHDIR